MFASSTEWHLFLGSLMPDKTLPLKSHIRSKVIWIIYHCVLPCTTSAILKVLFSSAPGTFSPCSGCLGHCSGSSRHRSLPSGSHKSSKHLSTFISAEQSAGYLSPCDDAKHFSRQHLFLNIPQKRFLFNSTNLWDYQFASVLWTTCCFHVSYIIHYTVL